MDYSVPLPLLLIQLSFVHKRVLRSDIGVDVNEYEELIAFLEFQKYMPDFINSLSCNIIFTEFINY